VNTGTLIVLDGVATQNYPAGSSDLEAACPETGIEVGVIVVIDDVALDQNA
jgi:hypothetical protein